MQSKSLLIAIAAFAVTASGVHAYGGSKTLYRAGLNKDQVQAVVEASSLRAEGDLAAARNRLVEAGIDEETLRSIHREVRQEKQRLLSGNSQQDYLDFKALIKDSPLADIIISEDDYRQFVEAHQLRLSGQWDEARDILVSMGINQPRQKGVELTQPEWKAYQVAHQANKKATAKAILREAGIEN
jgi:hypothetical protein